MTWLRSTTAQLKHSNVTSMWSYWDVYVVAYKLTGMQNSEWIGRLSQFYPAPFQGTFTFVDVSTILTNGINMHCWHTFCATCLSHPVYSWRYSFNWLSIPNDVASASRLQSINFYVCFLSKWDDDLKPFEIMISAAVFLFLFVFNLLTCEFGEKVAGQFEQFGVELGRCEWNNLPIGMQRMYLTFLFNIQQPRNIQIAGRIVCTCETFKRVHH